MGAHVFISYAHADNDSATNVPGIVTRLERYLEVVGRQKYGDVLEIYTDKDLASGHRWKLEIIAKARKARIFMPVISPSWINSVWCNEEWDVVWDEVKDDFRLGNRTPIIPISFELDDHSKSRLGEKRDLQLNHHFRNGMSIDEFEKVANAIADEIKDLL
jgi:hypothetical protein